MLLAGCAENDRGGAVLGVHDGSFEELEDDKLRIPIEAIDLLEVSSHETGVLFADHVTLKNGDEGVLVVMHYDSELAQYN